ncbi:integrase core domain-containing protein [Blastococcus sp. BMG 814]|uniref:Integrase core domain-containing protein n=1 Tax=Blastococcus carthaginiensis TaxID=3050034 RepID=A0ABT9I7N7_9ACTN|nr:IS3 family transposase [Blastococcus carthaginiensis]MDP5181563.1 integrase core domain-containing protein [Blastococcus carthaginiensis]
MEPAAGGWSAGRWPPTYAASWSSTPSAWRSLPASPGPVRPPRRPGQPAQYTSDEFGRTLRTSGVLASMGRVGSAYDDAMIESFFATLKEGLVHQRAWPTRHELETEVFSRIEGFYNPTRLHGRLDSLSPAACERTSRSR